ncbi:Uncharacterised protein [uncultured archaeon]|nr:Uncharacterised protein [uncultured archaeon]
MSDFIKVLAAGVALIIVALLISQTSIFRGEVASSNVTIFSQSIVGQIGSLQETFRRIPLGSFEAGQTLGEEVAKNISEATIQNGVFSEHSESFPFAGNGAIKAYMTFDVADTNAYGNLQLYFNGREIYNNVTQPGTYRVEMTQPAASNTLEIKTTSSGAKFWAPTTYILRNIKLVVERYGNQEYVIPFTVFDYEAIGWSTGRLLFGIDDAIIAGDLLANVNGQEVYRDRPISRSMVYQTDFTKEKAQIHAGENTIRFRTEKDGKYSISNAELLLFFFTGTQSVEKKMGFNVDEGQLLLYKEQNSTGQITFDADNIYLDRGITVELNNKPFELSNIVKKEEGTTSINFSVDDLRAGKNTINFKTRGSYSISDVNVMIVTPSKDSASGGSG